jgi:hypothetical protein
MKARFSSQWRFFQLTKMKGDVTDDLVSRHHHSQRAADQICGHRALSSAPWHFKVKYQHKKINMDVNGVGRWWRRGSVGRWSWSPVEDCYGGIGRRGRQKDM